MTTLENYFSDNDIAVELCKARVKLAERRHEALFFHNIDRSQPHAEEIRLPASWGDVPLDIFPPRKLWNRYRPKDRNGIRDINLQTLIRAVRQLSREHPAALWAKRLRKTVAMIRCQALCKTPFTFTPPMIVAEVKNRKQHTYRPLALFSLTDKIIDCRTTQHFRDALDSVLLDCCLWNRVWGDGRHEALETIMGLRKIHASTGLFVAECDIRGFFDCVSHDVARTALSDLIADAQARAPQLQIHPRALEIFDAYLSCYSFLRNIRAELDPKTRDAQAEFPWPEQELRGFHGPSSDLDAIGVPQGGSLSLLIANAVLHQADKEVSAIPGIAYLRYCDDMLVLAPEQQACAEAFDCYRSVMARLKLPIHEPQPLPSYVGSQKSVFWAAKTKPVYRWSDAREPGCFPWLQFLGYQVRNDGAVRIRPSSIGKHLAKLADETGKMLGVLQPSKVSNIRRSPASILHRFRMRLISIGVGRTNSRHRHELHQKCWANGFRWLLGKDVILNSLKRLDRQRERQLSRVARRLNEIEIQAPEIEGERQRVLMYYGFPFSYCAQFKRDKRPAVGDDQPRKER